MSSENSSSNAKKNLQSLVYSGGEKPSLKVLDQLLVPKEKTYIDVKTVKDAWTVIRTMQIRGAPLIAIVACLGLAVDLCCNEETKEKLETMNNDDGDDVIELIQSKMEYLKTSRPTAVNLFNAMKELDDVIKSSQKKKQKTEDDATRTTVKDRIINAVLEHAEFMLKRDIQDNRNIGKYGAEIVIETYRKQKKDEEKEDDKKYHVVTICNTGSLATAEYGTALGVVRALNEQKKLGSVTALETRPYNQGSRLTAFEIVEEQFPGGTLICDSAIGARMSSTKHSQIDACVVGADRVCANGDTANKIGTYNLALVAASHNVPFFVASPFTTLDCTLSDGSAIEIEERPANELIESSNAPKTIQCWNPAFDVTPAKYITGIITEKGIITPDKDGKIDVVAFVAKHSN